VTHEQPSQFIYVFDPVRPEMISDPDSWTERDTRIAQEHFSYLKAATEAGTVLLAGRALDGQGPAVVIIEVEDQDEAQRFMGNDPFVSRGLMRASLHPFRAALVRKP